MQTLSLDPSLPKARSEADAVAHLAVRLASLRAQLEAAIFERDLAQRAQARLAEDYRVLAQRLAALPTLPPDLMQKLELTLRERAQLEHEAQLLRQQCERLQTDSAHWHAAHDCLVEERQQLLRDVANLSADTENLHTYAVSQRQFLAVVQHSRRWRFGQTVAGWFGRRWK